MAKTETIGARVHVETWDDARMSMRITANCPRGCGWTTIGPKRPVGDKRHNPVMKAAQTHVCAGQAAA